MVLILLWSLTYASVVELLKGISMLEIGSGSILASWRRQSAVPDRNPILHIFDVSLPAKIDLKLTVMSRGVPSRVDERGRIWPDAAALEDAVLAGAATADPGYFRRLLAGDS